MATTTITLPMFTQGSKSWLESSIEFASAKLLYIDKDARQFYDKAKELIDNKAWEIYFDDEPKSWERFLREALGVTDIEDTLAVLRGVELAIESGVTGPIPSEQARRAADYLAAVAVPLNPNGTNQHKEKTGVDNNQSLKGGTDPEYLTARIARDRPDILERMKAGEFKSVRAAAIEAGIVKDSGKIILCTSDPDQAAHTLLKAIKAGKIDRAFVDRMYTAVKLDAV